MANVNGPFGLRPFAMAWGGYYTGAARTYYVPATNTTALFLGDPIALISNSSDGNGVPAVEIATAGVGNFFLGAMMGVSNNAGASVITVQWTTPVYVPANTAAYIYVSDDPQTLYAVQENGAMASGASGGGVDLVAGSGSTVTGFSGWQLNSSTLAHGGETFSTQSTWHQMRIIELLQKEDNAVGTNAKWLCKINTNSWNNPVSV